MQVQVHRQGAVAYAVIDDFFDPREYASVKKELLDIRRFADAPDTTDTAKTANGILIKQGLGVFLDDLYRSNRNKSDILTHSAKLFNHDLVSSLAEKESSFLHLIRSTSDSTLVNYYSDGGYYDIHHDTTTLTAVWFDAIKNVIGGDFIFPAYQINIKSVPNRMVVFHGCIQHGATPVAASDGAYRVSVAKFIGYK